MAAVDWVQVWSWIQQNILTIVGLVGSVIAFVFAVWQGLYTRLNARISALPLLHSFQEAPIERVERPYQQASFHCHLLAQIVNGGLGPAIITKYEVYVDGRLVDLSDRKAFNSAVVANVFGLDPDQTKADYLSLDGGAVAFPKDEKRVALSLHFYKPTPKECTQVVDRLGRLGLHVEYQSMHGDELVFDNKHLALPPKLGLFFLRKRA